MQGPHTDHITPSHLHHFNHASRSSLDVVAARVEGEALAHNSNLPLDLARGLVCQVDELGRLRGSCVRAEVCACVCYVCSLCACV